MACDVINIPSPTGELQMAEYMTSALGKTDLNVTWQNGRGRANVVPWTGSGRRKNLMFTAMIRRTPPRGIPCRIG